MQGSVVSAFAHLPISHKLMAAFAAVVVAIFASSAIVYDRLLVIEDARNRRVHTTDVLETLEKAMDAMVDQETGLRGYLITGDERFLEPYQRGDDAYTAAMRKLKDLTTDNPAQQSRLDELNELAKTWRSEIAERQIALMAKPETREETRALEGSAAGKAAMDLIRAKVDEIDRVERDLLAKRDAVQKQAFATAYAMTILGGAASLIVATLMGVLLTRGITVPITRMTGAMTALARGDTGVEVPGVHRRDEIGAMAAAVEVFRDSITERKRAEDLTGQVFETSPDVICLVGRDYRYQRVNPVLERNWGLSAERIVGKHVADIVGTNFFEQTLKPNYDRCFAGEEISFAEWFTIARGRRYWAVTHSPLRLGSERVEAALVIARDLTDHMLASEALREARTELEHVNRVATMGQLTASIAHEVNQPIAATVTNAQAALRWLGARPPDLDEVRQTLGRIVNDGQRAGDVIGRIRALIKKAPARKDSLDINEAIREVIVLTRGEVEKNGVSVRTQLATGLPSVGGDRIELQQVILNLIMNAVEAMSGMAEGKLQIRTEREAAGGVLVTVRDSGPGLDPTSVNRLFEAFYTTKPEGMGMGLAICRSIIEAHGGRMWADANESRGAAFQFTLPLKRDETVPAEPAGHVPVV